MKLFKLSALMVAAVCIFGLTLAAGGCQGSSETTKPAGSGGANPQVDADKGPDVKGGPGPKVNAGPGPKVNPKGDGNKYISNAFARHGPAVPA